MSQRRKRIFVAVFLSAAFAVTAGFAVQNGLRARQYERMLKSSGVHAFYELTAASQELTTALQKAAYATPGPLRDCLYGQIYAKALAAQYALGEVPLRDQLPEQTAAFYARVGDYAAALTRGTVDGSEESLAKLSLTARALTDALFELQRDVDAGTLILYGSWSPGDQSGVPAGGSAFQSIESDFPEVPSLVYDGPFSEHLSSAAPRALEGLPAVSQREAQAAAAAFLGRSVNALTFLSAGGGPLPTYSFSIPQDGGLGYIEVTHQGGKVLSYFQDRAVRVEAEGLSVDEAVQRAEAMLARWGYPDMKHSYTLEQEGAVTIHFAPVADGVYCYPDLVKVTLALSDGSLLGFEGHGYLSQHRERTFEPPAISMEDALGAVPGPLTVLSSQMALIPTGGGTDEVLTYEFKCEANGGSHVLVYVNAQSGVQQNILLLLEDETGTLAL